MLGESDLKHIFSVLLAFILMLTSFSMGFVAVAQTAPMNSELTSFANNLSNMIRTYDSANNKSDETSNHDLLSKITDYFPIAYSQQVFTSSFAETEDANEPENSNSECIEGLSDNAFELKRLIVKSKTEIDNCGAIDCVSGYNNMYILQYGSVEDTVSAYKYYSSLDSIEYVEPDLVYKTQESEIKEVIPSEDLGVETEDFVEVKDKVESWNTKEIGFDAIRSKLSEIKLVDVVVAVLDSGIDTDHEMFEGRLIDNFVNCSTSGAENSVEDDFGHGTHVAGIIADNSLKNVKIKPYKVLNNEGKGTLSSIVVAIDLAVEEKVNIINMSFTAEGESQAMTDSVNNAVEKGINVVVAAGNKGVDLTKKTYTPACIESAITVSATTKDHKLSKYSNYNGPIDIAAPGDDVISAYLNNTYVSMSGTSMATPQVSAAIALVRSIYKEKNNHEIKEFIEQHAIELKDDSNTNKFGAGLLYIKNIFESKPRTVEPTFSVESTDFVNSFNLSISCLEENAKILYVKIERELDGSFDISKNLQAELLKGATTYTGVIPISVDTAIAAVAVAEGKSVSHAVIMKYNRRNESEADLYDINSSGMITGYVGSETDLIVPDTIQGKVVKGVGSSAFKGNKKVHSVVLPSTATHIGVEAFQDCTNLEYVKGEGLTHINISAFANSSISEFSFGKVKNISDKAFYNCKNLKNVDLTNAEVIGVSAFENASGIGIINNDKLTALSNYAFRNSDVVSVNLPNLKTLGTSAFEKCANLESVELPIVTAVPLNAFKNCTSLSAISIPNALSIGNYAFQASALEKVYFDNVETVGNYAFRDIASLKYVFLPNATDVGSSCFYNCPSLKFVYMPVLYELNANTFFKCSSLASIYLPAVKTVSKNAFNNSSLEYIQFDTVETIASLPNTLMGLVLPSTLVEITASIPQTEFVVYGYENTLASKLAEENSKEFVDVPAMICKTSESVSIDEKYIFTYAIGFNCTYQWYKNDTVSNENGTLIDGATDFYYEPTKDDNAVSYYCVIISDDGVNQSEIITEPVTNILEYQDADYSEYDLAVEEAKAIERELYTENSLSVLDKLLSKDISGYSLAQQDLISQHIQAIKDALSSLVLDYVLGDINADGKISLIDARIALKNVSGTQELNELQTLSADMNKDGKISLIDVRTILRIISEMAETE